MLTVHCSGRLMGGVVSARGCVSAQGVSAPGMSAQGCLPRGGVCPEGVSAQRGVCLGAGGMGVCRGSFCPRGVSARGMSAQRVYTSCPPCGQNSGHTLVKTYISALLLRTVIRGSNVHDCHTIIHFKFKSGFSVLLFSEKDQKLFS